MVKALKAMNEAASNPQRILDSIVSTVSLARIAGIMLIISYLIASYPVLDL